MTSENFVRNLISRDLKILPKDILALLKDLREPATNQSILDTKRISDIIISGKRINITLGVSKEELEVYEPLRQEIQTRVEDFVKNIKGAKVFVIMTAHHATPESKENPLARGRFELQEIRNIIAVASGKGGVGKSTTTVNLAYALKQQGYRVGILDADIYGPSIPKMMGIKERPQSAPEDPQTMIPIEKDGIQLISMGFLVEEETPVIWRGPIVQKAIQQFLKNVRWYDLDVLLLDLPPGTGDIQLTLISKASITGAVIVSTPQDVALIDAKKAIAMFKTVEVPVLGLIENMSYFCCPHCQGRSEIFSHGGARNAAKDLGVAFLGEIPLQVKIRKLTDTGRQEELVSDLELGYAFRTTATLLSSHLVKKGARKSA